MTTPLAAPSLAVRLRARREERMLSQVEAAAELGVSRRIYQAWEAGDVTSPRPRLRRRLEAWLTELEEAGASSDQESAPASEGG